MWICEELVRPLVWSVMAVRQVWEIKESRPLSVLALLAIRLN